MRWTVAWYNVSLVSNGTAFTHPVAITYLVKQCKSDRAKMCLIMFCSYLDSQCFGVWCPFSVLMLELFSC